MSNYWKSVICVGSGNEGTSAGHTSGMLKEREEQRVELGVQQREPALNVQLWKDILHARVALHTPEVPADLGSVR